MVKRLVVFVLLFLSAVELATAHDLKLYFFNVGEGDATLVKTKDAAVLIDAGNLITGFSLVRKLRKLGVKRIDALIITHPHPDHMGGVFHVLQAFRVKSRFDNGQPLPVERDIYRWYGQIFRTGTYRVLRAKDTLRFGALKIDVLSPYVLGRNWNDNSLVLRLSFGKMRFLFMADASLRVEKRLLDAGCGLRSVLLKVGHHGAKDATSVRFLKAVSPRISVIFAARHHFHGYPSASVVRRIKCAGSLLFITGFDGDILVETDGRILKFRRVDNL
ncbi:MAG: MBL fold metallo-hydrolase [Deferribacteres bacterium]|nr:MBL fold metallo-hydrolase [Deferribacteres bacterium]